MSQREASIAVRRFGLGPRPGDIARVASDPRGYVLASLNRRDAGLVTAPDLEPSHLSLTRLREAQMALREARNAVKGEARPGGGPGNGEIGSASGRVDGMPAAPPTDVAPRGNQSGAQTAGANPLLKPGQVRREVFREEARGRIAHAVATDQPFVERLVMFWSNHFAISAAKGLPVRVTAGAFEREAIRPHVLGRFSDMLRAVEQHPAMLIYLDNAQSIGPNSPAGRHRGRGLNENLAREILELHTVGVNGGYSQADVTAFARILTGWSVAVPQMPATAKAPLAANGAAIAPGQFIFTPNRHEPGPQTVMGKRYEDRGQSTGEAVLADLARHPATARHIAMKLARHFVSDTPPAALVERLDATFRATGGDLAALARALASADEAWQAPPRKVVPPYDFLVSVVRGLAIEARPPEMVRLAAAIGQPLWAPPSPKGWPDDDDAWMGPSAVRERLRIAERVARLVDRAADPRAVASDLFGPDVARETRLAIERAEAREQGFELLVMSPQFLRR